MLQNQSSDQTILNQLLMHLHGLCPQINVFILGRHYLKLVRALNVKLPVLDPSIYIIRFAALLHFGDETNRVASDAVRLCNRFKKDWLSDGRRPAGICGAALLLAARMNNFRRSMNEIVQVVKMADVTIRERLEEFKRTPSAQLSLADFQNIWLAEEYEPPAFYRPAIDGEKKQRREAKRQSKEEAETLRDERRMARLKNKGILKGEEDESDEANDADEEDDADEQRAAESSVNGVTGGLAQGDDQELPPHLDSLANEATRQQIEAYTMDPEFQNLDREAERLNLESQQRARKGGSAVLQAPTAIDLALLPYQNSGGEAKVSSQNADQGRNDPDNQPKGAINASDFGAASEAAELATEESEHLPVPAPVPATGQALLTESQIKQSASQGGLHAAGQPGKTAVEDTLEDLDEDELDQFILGPEEVRIKERVWLEFNHDYLQQALKRQLKEEADEKAGIRRRPPRNRKPPPKPRDSSTAQGNSAIESTRQMMQKKAKTVSKKLNYDVMSGLEGLFGHTAGLSGYGQPPSQKKRKKNSQEKGSRHNRQRTHQYDSTTDTESTDAEERQIRAAANYFNDEELEVVEEEGDALPSNHPERRAQSKAERANKRRKEKDRVGSKVSGMSSATSGGEESGTDYGTQHGQFGASGLEDEDDDDDPVAGLSSRQSQAMQSLYGRQEDEGYDEYY